MISVLHIDVRSKRRIAFEDGGCLDDVRRSGTLKYTGKLGRDIMLYMVSVEQQLKSKIITNALTAFGSLAVTSKDDDVNKLHEIFHSHSRHVQAFIKRGFANGPFDLMKNKPVSFKKFFKPCKRERERENVFLLFCSTPPICIFLISSDPLK